MLENFTDNLIIKKVENQLDAEGNQILDEHQLFFQRDGAPPPLFPKCSLLG